MRALVPGGYMVGAPGAKAGATITITICGDATGMAMQRTITVPRSETSQERAAQHAKNAACPFSALSMAGTPGIDPLLLAAALAFIVALGLGPQVAPKLAARDHVRPPLRGPPRVV